MKKLNRKLFYGPLVISMPLYFPNTVAQIVYFILLMTFQHSCQNSNFTFTTLFYYFNCCHLIREASFNISNIRITCKSLLDSETLANLLYFLSNESSGSKSVKMFHFRKTADLQIPKHFSNFRGVL